jgi:signal transduction histidine kinase/CheY-like chemotaxis protein
MLEGLVVQASDGTVITHNPAALKILKLTEKQIIGRQYLVSDEQSIRENGRPFPEAEHPATVALKSKAAIKNIVMGIDNGSNEVRWILINSTPFEADEGLNTLTTFTDITEERKLQEETSFILNSMQVGTWKLDVDKKLLSWDDNNYEIFGVDREEFADPSDAWLSRLHPNSKKSAIQDLADALEGKSVFNTTFEIITSDGSQKFLGGRGEVFRDHFGVVTRMVGINWDKTTEHLASLELEQQKKLIQHHTKLASIGELAAGVGHEINNPLAVAKGLLFSLNQQKLDQSIPVAATLSKVNHALDRIASIVKGLRTFSRIEEDEVAHFNVIGALEESIALMEDMYKSEGISIIYSAGAETNALGIDGSRGKLQQIFVNLLSNAKDAVKGCEIKNIHISTQIESNRLKISFKDSGCGIPKNIIDRIFDPFFTTKDVSEGTGIGLSLVYNFVNEFGGSVTVKSEEFQGAELVVDLLVTDFDSSNNIIEHNKITTDQKIDCSIILADDEEGIRDVLAIIIENMGATVSTAENGREALALYLADPDKYDIIISDIKMPVMGGVELLQTIRTNKNLKQPKFIFITGGINIDFGASDNQLSQLIDAHFFKPFDYEEIFETLMKLSN